LNWLDIAIIALILICIIWGGKTGLFNAALYGIGLIISWSISGYASQTLANIFNDNATISTTVSILCYLIVLGGSIVVIGRLTKLIQPATFIIDILTVGLNRVAGLLIGLIIGILTTSILICGLARFTYDLNLTFNVNVPTTGINSQKIGNKIENTRSYSEKALIESKSAKMFIRILVSLPSDAFKIIPSQYMAPLEILHYKGQS
tara:strand:+ start:10906 stop:11520 length:615 start_codon:yes stop_codon:yes gene_type:complete